VYFLYTDASGTPELQDQTKEYALVGVALSESAWQAFDLRIIAVKQKYGLVQTKAELHAKDFCIGFNEQSDIAGFEGLGWNERRVAVTDLRKTKLPTYSEAKRKEKLAYFQRTLPYIHLSRAERSALLGARPTQVEVRDQVGTAPNMRSATPGTDLAVQGNAPGRPRGLLPYSGLPATGRGSSRAWSRRP
jgi:hypothetical protein